MTKTKAIIMGFVTAYVCYNLLTLAFFTCLGLFVPPQPKQYSLFPPYFWVVASVLPPVAALIGGVATALIGRPTDLRFALLATLVYLLSWRISAVFGTRDLVGWFAIGTATFLGLLLGTRLSDRSRQPDYCKEASGEATS